jgi:hypothetical protein
MLLYAPGGGSRDVCIRVLHQLLMQGEPALVLGVLFPLPAAHRVLKDAKALRS